MTPTPLRCTKCGSDALSYECGPTLRALGFARLIDCNGCGRTYVEERIGVTLYVIEGGASGKEGP